MADLLNDKVCIISGAGKGIGRAAAELFAENGAKLALITRSRDDVSSLQGELNLASDDLLCVAGDVSDEAAVKKFVAETAERFGQIDVLLNNAGMRFRKDFLDITRAEFDEVLSVNLGSVFSFCQATIPIMRERRKGKIINVSSVAGVLGLSHLSGYVTSKAAMVGLTKSLALEFAEDNIQINAVAPGFAKSSYYDNFKQKKDLHQFTLDRTPMKRWGENTEIANACLFLASDLSSYVTGETLMVDGGWSAW